ncbi:MAG TPA: DUF3857 and transglutaminase domain-containing protein [Candidatus Didemnitutus sp.]
MPTRRFGVLLFALLALPGSAVAAKAITWESVPAEDRNAKPPAGAPDAPAEILSERVNLLVKDYKAVQRSFIRIKIYSERAIDEVGKIGIDYSDSERVSGLAARVVHPDGESAVLPESAFQESVLGRWNHGRQLSKRLVVPRLAPGDIVDIQWRVDADGRFKGARFVNCQRTIPVRFFEFKVHNSHSGPMNVATFGAHEGRIEGTGTQDIRVTMKNLPPYVEEPDMPPAFNSRATMLLVYGELPDSEEETWLIGAILLGFYEKTKCAPTSDMTARARKMAAGLTYRDEQLKKIYDFCQSEIVNIAYADTPEALDERFTFHEPRTAEETWKLKRGNPLEIDCLFVALAQAAGFEARLSFSANRDEIMDVHFSHGWYFMRNPGALVRVDGEWRPFSPGDRAVPFGLCRWQREEMESCFLNDDPAIEWVKFETTLKDRATQQWTGRLAVDASGALSGEITQVLEGQFGIAWRETHWSDDDVGLKNAVRDDVLARLPEAEVTGISVANLHETEEPLLLRFHLHLAAFGAVAGSRMVVAPGLFQLHAQPRYTAKTRIHPIRWSHPWMENENLEYVLPPGFEIARASVPPPINVGDGLIAETVRMSEDASPRRLIYERRQKVGRTGETTFTTESYATLRAAFDEIDEADHRTVILQRPDAPVPAKADPPGTP